MLTKDKHQCIAILKWRSRRSMLELDIIFSKFINNMYLESLSNEELQLYIILIAMDDFELLTLLNLVSLECVDNLSAIEALLPANIISTKRVNAMLLLLKKIINGEHYMSSLKQESNNIYANTTVNIAIDNQETLVLPILKASMGEDVVDMRTFGNKSKMWSYDPAFLSTASCQSKITYIDGEAGKLAYRGYPIEQLAKYSTHLESAYLLLYGELPTATQLQQFKLDILQHNNLPDNFEIVFHSFAKNAHPMAILTSLVAILSAYYPDNFNFDTVDARNLAIYRIVAKMPIITAMIYRHTKGLPFVPTNHTLDYAENFLYMMFCDDVVNYKVNPIIAKAFDQILLLHADHEQNASTSTVRVAGSSGTHPFAAIAAGVACLWGPAHGGANEAVLKMLEEIGHEDNVDSYVAGVKDKKYRLMGFGHRVYKNIDPRASIIRQSCYDVLEVLGKHDDPLLKLAMKLEKVALSDDYFISKKLYPNVDFYSGIILRAIGIPTEMFTTIFALSRSVGWLAQLQEMITDSDFKISRPRQLYTGHKTRDYTDITKR